MGYKRSQLRPDKGRSYLSYKDITDPNPTWIKPWKLKYRVGPGSVKSRRFAKLAATRRMRRYLKNPNNFPLKWEGWAD